MINSKFNTVIHTRYLCSLQHVVITMCILHYITSTYSSFYKRQSYSLSGLAGDLLFKEPFLSLGLIVSYSSTWDKEPFLSLGLIVSYSSTWDTEENSALILSIFLGLNLVCKTQAWPGLGYVDQNKFERGSGRGDSRRRGGRGGTVTAGCVLRLYL